ncbi:uncharacterized protein BJ212DRAFT_1533922 [Suillus subaureus]|uniref:Uncharacterized protein n=1 Tax=Suillus subaureus TaxID=48587 RepID=A0A9P7EKJ6_9AGAM|nr:uncharacterized protein BJ212DRAFT_1533922 [Suillus subaureus]KAG1823849.1 hypothetical protein BJ212DRAFT_1533922 [Suillus subaureus]
MKLMPLSLELKSKQATINLGAQSSAIISAGTICHVAHRKSTVVKAISGTMTVQFKN